MARKIKDSFKVGLGFGVTSGVMTTLGLLIGLYSGTNSQLIVIGGILTIAVADAFADSLGVHISREFESRCSTIDLWEATISTFFTKFFVALTFVIPVLLFSLRNAVIVSIIWGLSLIAAFSFLIEIRPGKSRFKIVFEHLLTASIVIVISNFVGYIIRNTFLNS